MVRMATPCHYYLIYNGTHCHNIMTHKYLSLNSLGRNLVSVNILTVANSLLLCKWCQLSGIKLNNVIADTRVLLLEMYDITLFFLS